jgi:hypothetical protein
MLMGARQASTIIEVLAGEVLVGSRAAEGALSLALSGRERGPEEIRRGVSAAILFGRCGSIKSDALRSAVGCTLSLPGRRG